MPSLESLSNRPKKAIWIMKRIMFFPARNAKSNFPRADQPVAAEPGDTARAPAAETANPLPKARRLFAAAGLPRPGKTGLVLAVAAALTASCSPQSGAPEAAADGRVQVVTTATMVGDMVEAIGGERVAVDNLMGPGVDPHLYRPSVKDIARVNQTDAVFYVGLFFEELMQEVLRQRKEAGHKVYALGDAIPREELLEAQNTNGVYDPHVWFDVRLWAHCVDVVRDGLIELDPEGRDYFEERAAAYRARLLELHEWAVAAANELPPENRILITSHDAYNYFGRAYGFNVVGLVGISTASEAGLADLTRLVDFIKENEVKAIFVESSVSPRAIERVSRDAGVVIGGELFSDALGPKGQERLGFDVGTYEGMVRYNLTTIIEALR